MRGKKTAFLVLFVAAAVGGVAAYRSSLREAELPHFHSDRVHVSKASENRSVGTSAAVKEIIDLINPPGSRWKEIKFGHGRPFPIKMYAGDQVTAEFAVTKFFVLAKIRDQVFGRSTRDLDESSRIENALWMQRRR